MKAVLFDLDGTIIDSKPGIFASAAFALHTLSLDMPSEKDMKEFLGPPLADGFRYVCHVCEELVGDAVRLYREYYNNGGKFEAVVYDGVKELLLSLRSMGLACYITTSKPHVYAKQILEHFDIASLFDGVYGCELDGTRGKKSEVIEFCLQNENLTAKDVVLVGDRRFDVAGASLLGVPCIGVLYGYGSADELLEAGTEMLAEDTAAINRFLRALME